MSRLQKGRRAALKAAHQSKFYAHRVGAALFLGSRLISIGWNLHKSHPECQCLTQHAEFSVIKRTKHIDLTKATLYVARLTRTNKVSYAKPCGDCQDNLFKFGVNRVYYTGYNGDVQQLEF